jgi:hypothetical protein
MGLAVVGRLASRYGIRVELRANIEGGTVAQVVLPSTIVLLPNRPIDPPRNRTPQLDSGPSGGWNDALPGRGGAATATLPAISPEPWQLPAPQHPSLPLMPSQRQPVPLSPAPQMPSRSDMPTRTDMPAPTTSRPPLPTRVAQPADSSPLAQSTRGARHDLGAQGALGSPTVAYPTLNPQASPDLQVAVGFVAPDGTKIPPPPRPASPNPNGWGAALAAMPAAPPPPAPTPVDERAEAPIFLQMQASWFKGHDGASPDDWGMPTAGYAPPPSPASHASPAAPEARSMSAAQTSGATAVAAPAPSAAPAATPAAPVSGNGLHGYGASNGFGREDRASTRAAGSGTGQNGARPANAGTDNGGSQPVPRQRNTAEDHWKTAADEGWQRAMAAAEPPDAGTTRSGLPKRVPQAQLVPGGVQTGPRNQNRRSPDEVRGLLSAYHRGVQRGRTAGTTEAVGGAPAPKENEQ